jgi:hypothetical protein
MVYTVTPGGTLLNVALSRIESIIGNQSTINMDPNGVIDDGDEEMLGLQGLTFDQVYYNRMTAKTGIIAMNHIHEQNRLFDLEFKDRNFAIDVQLEIPEFETHGSRLSLRFSEASPLKDNEDPIEKARTAHVKKHQNQHNLLASGFLQELEDTWVKMVDAEGFISAKTVKAPNWMQEREQLITQLHVDVRGHKAQIKDLKTVISSFEAGLGPSFEEHEVLRASYDALMDEKRTVLESLNTTTNELKFATERLAERETALEDSLAKQAQLQENIDEGRLQYNFFEKQAAIAAAELATFKECMMPPTLKRPRPDDGAPPSAARADIGPSPLPMGPYGWG